MLLVGLCVVSVAPGTTGMVVLLSSCAFVLMWTGLTLLTPDSKSHKGKGHTTRAARDKT
jgi:hypothetical protein